MKKEAVQALISRWRWAVIVVGSGVCDVPGCKCGPECETTTFAYSVGMTLLDHPEFIISGMAPKTAHTLINYLCQDVAENGKQFKEGDDSWLLAPPMRSMLINATTEKMVFANRHFPDAGVRALQMVYGDPFFRLPWEPGADNDGHECFALNPAYQWKNR